MQKSHLVLSLRLPAALYHAIKARADLDNRSMNRQVIHYIEEGMAQGNDDLRRLLKLADDVNRVVGQEMKAGNRDEYSKP